MKKKWIQRQQQIVDAARAAGRDLTEAEEREFQDLQRKIDAAGEEGPTGTGARSATPAAEGGSQPAEGTPAADGGQPAEGTRSATPTGADAAQRAVAAERQRVPGDRDGAGGAYPQRRHPGGSAGRRRYPPDPARCPRGQAGAGE